MHHSNAPPLCHRPLRAASDQPQRRFSRARGIAFVSVSRANPAISPPKRSTSAFLMFKAMPQVP